MLYAATKANKFLPADPARRAMAWQWLMPAVTDVARASTSIFLCSTIVPDRSAANTAYFEEPLRFLRVADARLARREFLADELSVADFALYPLYAVRKALVDKSGAMPELTRWGALWPRGRASPELCAPASRYRRALAAGVPKNKRPASA